MVFVDMAIRVHGYLGDMHHGARASDIYQSVVDQYALSGWASFCVHHLSHGLGWGGDVPRVASGSDQILQKGDALSCEPGCYVPGRGGARVENMIWISDTGPVELTKTPLNPELAS